MFSPGVNLPSATTIRTIRRSVMANFMLGGGFLNSRLATRHPAEGGPQLRRQLAAAGQLARQVRRLFSGCAIYAPQNAAKLEAAFKEELARVLRDGFTQDELDAARAGWLQGRTVTRSQDQQLASRMATDLTRADAQAGHRSREQGAALDVAQVNAALRKYVSLER